MCVWRLARGSLLSLLKARTTMQVKVYVIDIPFPKRAMKAALYVMTVALVLVLRSDVDATPAHFSAGTTLTASAIQSLNIVVHGTTQYSVGATVYACAAPTTAGGNLGGYTGAKALCEAACGSPTAHMCMSDEIGRSLQLGFAPPSGFYATAMVIAEAGNLDDCFGWTQNVAGRHGAALQPGSTVPQPQPCNSSIPVLCCD